MGARLRAAREAQGLALDDVAARTRVPRRHLEAIEAGGEGGGGGLPAEAYSAGFVRAYARLVGLDADAFARAFRGDAAVAPAPLPIAPPPEAGRHAAAWPKPAPEPAREPAVMEAYERPVDDADALAAQPRFGWWALALAAAAALILVAALAVLLRGRDRAPAIAVGIPAIVAVPAIAPAAPGPPGKRARAPVAAVDAPPKADAIVITARKRVWLRVYEQDGRTLFSGILRGGQRYVVPAAARDPRVSTGLPSALALSRGGRALAPLPAPRLVIGAPLDRARAGA